jgi:hypothetical protein
MLQQENDEKRNIKCLIAEETTGVWALFRRRTLVRGEAILLVWGWKGGGAPLALRIGVNSTRVRFPWVWSRSVRLRKF